VGVWHETYAVEPGRYEALYGSMPLFGLAKATQVTRAVRPGQRRTARERLKGHPEPVAPELEVYD
jgi:hypothetical protein